jgi:uncharacterized membrane protein YbhN (UPF0104 family)
VGLTVLVLLVRHVGFEVVASTLRGALPWLPLLSLLELLRIVCATVASWLAFGALAPRIPKGTLLRAHVLGHSIGTVAPAPTVVNETIKATLIAPYTGGGPAAAVGFINQAATLTSVGLFSIPCGLAILAMRGASLWFWACVIHAVVLVACGIGLQAVTRAGAPGRWLVKRVPRLAEPAQSFRQHATTVRLGAWGPVGAMMVGRAFQVLQYFVAARAVGIDSSMLGALSAQGVNLVASAVFVLVPGGLGTTDGAFALAAGLLGTTVARATSLALLTRCTQLVWILIGSMVALTSWRKASPP